MAHFKPIDAVVIALAWGAAICVVVTLVLLDVEPIHLLVLSGALAILVGMVTLLQITLAEIRR